jgi:hypothetical protein
VSLSTRGRDTDTVIAVPRAGWRRLRDAGAGADVVLTVDFTVAKARAQAGFAELAPQLPDRFAVWSTDEKSWPTTPGDPSAQLAQWLDSGDFAGPVGAVFGFCASASLAGALAAHLAARDGIAPRLVLFDPVAVGPRTMVDQASESIRRLGTWEPDNDVDTVGDSADLDVLATRLIERYTYAAALVGGAQSIPQAIVEQLCERVSANVRFLALAAIAWSARRLAPDLTVLSRDHELPRALADAIVAPDRDMSPGRAASALLRLPVTQDELLADPGAAAALTRLFTGVAA